MTRMGPCRVRRERCRAAVGFGVWWASPAGTLWGCRSDALVDKTGVLPLDVPETFVEAPRDVEEVSEFGIMGASHS